MFDIAGITPDPMDGSLSFSMLDFNTFLTFQSFLNQEKSPIQALIDADEPDVIENSVNESKADKLFVTPSQKIESHLLAPNGGVKQLKKALQAVHMNLRVMNAKITFNLEKSIATPDISFDGVLLKREDDHNYALA